MGSPVGGEPYKFYYVHRASAEEVRMPAHRWQEIRDIFSNPIELYASNAQPQILTEKTGLKYKTLTKR